MTKLLTGPSPKRRGLASAVVLALALATGLPAAPPPTALDPQMKAVLGQLDAMKPRPIYKLPPADARKEPGAKDAAKELEKKRNGGALPPPEPVARVEDRTIPGPAGPHTVRVYTPREATADGKLPVLVFVHGGGWTLGSIAAYDPSARALCNAARCVVVSVSYRYAPENPFPAAHEDVYSAFQYVSKNAAEFGGDPRKVAIGGESAGGNLSAGVCLMARDRRARMPVHQVLVYPVTDTRMDTPTYRNYADAKPLDAAQMRYFIGNVTRTPRDRDKPYLAPLRARSLRGLPPATVITAEIDPLTSEGKAYADRLRASGVPVRYRDYKGVTHEFFSMGAVVDKADQAVAFAAEGLRAAFAD